MWRTAPAGRRRRPLWWAVGCLAVAAVALVVDLPVHASRGDRQAELAGYLAGVDKDVAPCRAALHDAVLAYVGSVVGRPAVTPGTAATFAEQGVAACGFSNTGVVALGSTEPPEAVASRAVDRIARQVDAWAYLDAFTLLQDLKSVVAHPGDRAALTRTEHDVKIIALRRAGIEHLVARAEGALGETVRPLTLTRVEGLLPGGALPSRLARAHDARR